MMKNRIDNECAVGIRAHSSEWHRLAVKLLKHPKTIAGDFSNYDGTLHPDVLWKIFDIIDKFYQYDDSYKPEDTFAIIRH